MSNSEHKRFVEAKILFCLFFSCFLCLLSSLSYGQSKTVKVVVYDFGRFFQGASEGKDKSGYCYEYLQAVAAFTGWKYEYVYTNDFLASLRLLEEGKVDLVPDVSRTAERQKTMLFPAEKMGDEKYYLYVDKSNDAFTGGAVSALRGKKAVVTKGAIQTEMLKEWMRKNDTRLVLEEVVGFSKKEKMVLSGKADLDLECDITASDNYRPVAYIGSSSYYLAVNRKRPDLLEDLNRGLRAMNDVDPDFVVRLEQRYFSQNMIDSILSENEKKWLARHSTVRVGVLRDSLPFSRLDGSSSKPSGLSVDFFEGKNNVFKANGINTEFFTYWSVSELRDALKKGMIDVAFPMYRELNVLEENGFSSTKAVYDSPMIMVCGEKPEKTGPKRIGVVERDLTYEYAKTVFPESQIAVFKDFNSCLNAVSRKKADCCIMQAFEERLVAKRLQNLYIQNLPIPCSVVFAVRSDDIPLLRLLNRGIGLFDKSEIANIEEKYGNWPGEYTFTDFVADNMYITFIVILALAAALGICLGNLKLSLKKTKELREKNVGLEREYGTALASINAKSTFLANMSEEIKRPMTVIIGYANFAAAHAGDPEKTKGSAERILASSNHLLSLINDVLDINRIENGTIVLHETECSLGDIFSGIRSIITEQVKQKKIMFGIDAEDLTDEAVYCDKTRMDQILFNLLSTAVRLTPEAGSVFLRLEQKKEKRKGYGCYQISVINTGSDKRNQFGDYLRNVLDKDKTDITAIQGAAYGLYVVKKLIDMMDGDISVISGNGNETEVRINLCLRLQQKNPEEENEALKNKTVLVVNSDFNVNDSVCRMLSDMGMVPEGAVTGSEAEQRIRTAMENGREYDDYVIDNDLTDTRGLELVRKIRQVSRKKAFVIMSAFNRGPIEAAGETGIDDIVLKPIIMADLKNRIRGLHSASGKKTLAGSDKLSDLRILLVEPDALSRDVLSEDLEKQGFSISIADSGEEALKLVSEGAADTYDLIVMELDLPGTDGCEAARMIRSLPDNRKNTVAMIGMSDNDFDYDRKRACENGMNGYVAKPVKTEEFTEEVLKVISRKRA